MKKYLEQLVVSEPNWCVPATLRNGFKAPWNRYIFTA